MKATGIVRRIDDLGRVVIPKEIRRTLRIREGRPAGNLHRPGRGNYIKKILPDRGAWKLCEAVCRESGTGVGAYGLHYGS